MIGWLWFYVTFSFFQLYCDGTVVQFSNLDLLPGTQRHGQLEARSLACRATQTRAPGRPKISLTSLPSEIPQVVRVDQISNPDLPIHSQARYLYATAAAQVIRLECVQKIVTCFILTENW